MSCSGTLKWKSVLPMSRGPQTHRFRKILHSLSYIIGNFLHPSNKITKKIRFLENNWYNLHNYAEIGRREKMKIARFKSVI